MKISEILSHVRIIRQDGDPSLEITGITFDSRRARPGSLFVAVPGFRLDGHDFIPEAREAGAAAVLTERWIDTAGLPQFQTGNARLSMSLAAAAFYGYPSRRMTVIGVTGTNGKTTTSYMIDSILRSWSRQTGLLGGVEYRVGKRSEPAARTTPEAVDLQRMLAEMLNDGVEAVTLEVSSHGIDLFRVAGLDFDVAVFTNLSREHLDLHGGMEAYFKTKRRLFMGDLGQEEGAAPETLRPVPVVNIDDAYGRRLASELPRAIGFSIRSDADIRAGNIIAQGWQSSFELTTPAGAAGVRLKLPGYYNIANALAAAGAAHALGAPPDIIAAGLGSFKGVPGRFELIDTDAPFTIIVDYAHNEDGLLQSLVTARKLTSKRLLLVFGCPGERDREKRPEMGRIAGSKADLAILTTDDCYGEPPDRILNETEPGLKQAGGDYLRIPDRRRAIATALAAAAEGDTVLIAGKGHEAEQILPSGPVPFSDRQVIKELLETAFR
ncbi:MAG: UDP-N-acetylmuramoyl-L-alanyl-D-glutamate--2,6-diaminopimelate ligase [Thermoleophilia bacterium]|nr:UDP-N-acetylmuramoyl-L-alanyl-D-glutamate--2,6-diaminopimelate ligase [Thermoleophilia bacterium]